LPVGIKQNKKAVILTLNEVKGKNLNDAGLDISLRFFLPPVVRMTIDL
jgi:hypothetical protein